MLLQQQMRLPVDAEYLPPQEMEDKESSFEDVIDDLIASRKRVFGDAKKNTTSAQTKQKESYDLKHQLVLFFCWVASASRKHCPNEQEGWKVRTCMVGTIHSEQICLERSL